MMDRKDIGPALDTIGVLGHPCEFDLLLFFYRHRRALLIPEDLARFLGYDVQQVERSLEILIGAGLLKESSRGTEHARMYVLMPGGAHGKLLRSLLQRGATREGRSEVISTLKERRSSHSTAP
jgi:DNA-binding MarR family transcriptional regulator